MFTYCNNNPVFYLDVEGGRPVGIGFQLDFGAGEETLGAEVVIYFDPKVCKEKAVSIVIYTYSGIDLSAEQMLSIQNIFDSISTVGAIELCNMDGDALLMFGKALMKDIECSVGAFYIDGNDSFDDPADYSGTFQTVSGSLYLGGHKWSGFYSHCDSCVAVGIKRGFATGISHWLPFDASYSKTEYSNPILLW